ncbi:MAG: MBOAT family protein [Lachnospiraceae bacterium]|nr:MBOAT family protein [Lachnospiraceae bacterium]
MVFSSTVFLFIFLPITYLLHLLIPSIKLKNAILIVASLAFYAFGEPGYIFLMLLSILANYGFARLIAATEKHAKLMVVLAIIFNIGMLVLFKYSALIISSCNALTGLHFPVPQIALPIGISFYTFQALSYCIDVYRDKNTVQKSVFKLMLYISLFPQLIAGPIVKYHDVEAQLTHRTMTIDKTAGGLVRFIYGLSKKLLISNAMALVVDTLFETEMNMALTAWAVAICYVLQIYFDFSGYSDMAIGLGKMFGFDFLENFNYPYISSSIQEFWRRWHISLSTWFKEYLYIPLGGNRKGEGRTLLNKFIVFVCTGIWHGANWTFLAWGLFHGLFIMLEYKKWIPFLKNKVLAHIYTMLVVICGFVIFRADTIGQAGHILASMFTGFTYEAGEHMLLAKLATPYTVCCLIVGIVLSTPVSKYVKNTKVLKYVTAVGLFILCVMSLATSSYNPFIYFRF